MFMSRVLGHVSWLLAYRVVRLIFPRTLFTSTAVGARRGCP